MPEPARRVVHAELADGLPRLEAGGRPFHVMWWWHGAPVGDGAIGRRGLPPRVLADRAARRVAEWEAGPGDVPPDEGGPALAVAIRAVAGERLERCLGALLAQADGIAEILVVDCTGAGELAAVTERFPGVAVLAAAPAGEGAARNLAVAATESEVVAFLSDADEVRPGWAARVRAAFADEEVLAVTGLTLPLELETEAQVVHETLLAGPGRRYDGGRAPAPRAALDGPLAMRRSALELAGGFDEHLGTGAGADLLGRLPAAAVAHVPAAAALAAPPRDAAALRRRARDRRRGTAAAGLAGGSPARAARALLAEPPRLAAAGARELLRRVAGTTGLTPRTLPRPAGAELRGHLEGLARATLRVVSPHSRHKAPLPEFLARNPFPRPLTEGFFYREKMRAVHRVAPDAPLARVLEIGGGRSGMARKLLPAAHVTSTDLDSAHAEAFTGDPQTTFMVADATALPFEDASFDAVTLLDVLEHIPDDAAAAREAWRVVRPGGWILVSSPNLRWRSPYHRIMRPICPTSEDMIARWEHVRVGYERDDLARLFGRPPAATADFINGVTVIAHDLAFSHLPGRARRILLTALAPVTWAGYLLQPRDGRGTETAASWRKPAA